MIGLARSNIIVPPGISLPLSGWHVLAHSAAAVSCPADVTEDTLATINVPANSIGANGILRISLAWSVTNNANAKTRRVRFSGGAGTIVSTGGTLSVDYVTQIVTIANRNAANSQFAATLANTNGGAAPSNHATAAVDTTAATSIVVTGQKGTAGDTMTLEEYIVELLYRP